MSRRGREQETPRAEAGGLKATTDTRHPSRLQETLAVVRFNLRSLIKPWSLLLLAVAALSSYYAVYISFNPPIVGLRNPPSWSDVMSALAGSGNVLGIHPILLMLDYQTLPWVIGGFTAFMFIGGTALVYVVSCGLVAEDSGCLPRNLLNSRPMSKTGFLVGGFLIRFAFFASLGFIVPFIVSYAQNVAVIGASAQSVITGYETMSQWYATAWNGLFWQYLAAFIAYLFLLAALFLLLTVATRRGLVGILVGLVLSYMTGYIAWQITEDYVTSGTTLGGTPSLPAFMFLIPAFYLIAAIDSTPGLLWRVQAPIFGFSTGTGLLLLYGVILLAISAVAYTRRSDSE